MKILFNTSQASRPITGIGTYIKELVTNLIKIDKRNKYILFSLKSPIPKRRTPFDFPARENVLSKSFIMPNNFMNMLWNNLKILPVDSLFKGVDILHSPDKIAPFARKAKTVLSIHDMSWYEIFKRRSKLLYLQAIDSIKRSEAIIAPSLFSKDEIIKYIPSVENKTYAVNSGVSERFQMRESKDIPCDINKKYSYNNYILYTGSLDEPRKNLKRLISAYILLKKKNKIKEKLLLCGNYLNKDKELFRLIANSSYKGDIIIYDKWVPYEEMPYLYNKAKIVVYPSLYEGFGFPILEAMASGKPVVTSNLSPMKEIAKDASLFIDPYDIKEISKAIERLIFDKNLYDILSKKGLERKNDFNWEKTATETIKIYESLC